MTHVDAPVSGRIIQTTLGNELKNLEHLQEEED
jgi:hypothetical protein